MKYTMLITDRCNLNCRYCYIDKKNTTMSIETARLAVDFKSLFDVRHDACRDIAQLSTEAKRIALQFRARERLERNGRKVKAGHACARPVKGGAEKKANSKPKIRIRCC
jgi:hypothetical protein